MQNGNYEECAQTKILTAAFVSGYLKLLRRFPKDLPDDFKSVFPNLEQDLTLPSALSLKSLVFFIGCLFNVQEGEICQSFTFTDDGFVDLLKQAIGMLKIVHI